MTTTGKHLPTLRPSGSLSHLPHVVVCAAASVIVFAVYLLRLDGVAGLTVDDAWYVMLARALAHGDGYTLVNAPTPGLLPPNPPGFAAMLSVLFQLSPEFPANVWLLKSVSIAAMMGVGVVSYHYFVSYRELPRPLAVWMAMALVVTPGFVFLATSTVMSECVFTLSQLLTVVLVERSARARGSRDTVVAAIFAAATVLIRSAGFPLLVAATLYLLTKRHWRRALVFAAVALVCLAPWLWYSHTYAPTMAQRLEHGGAHAFTYGREFWMRWAGDPSTGEVTVWDLPARAKDGLVDIFGRDMAGIVAPALFRGANESGQEVVALGGNIFPGSMGSAAGTMVLSFALTGLAAIGYIAAVRRGPTLAEFMVPLSTGLIALWPHWAYRFVLPLAPFLLFYLVAGIRTLAPREPLRVARVALLCVIGLNLADHTQYLLMRPGDWENDAQEAEAVLAWTRDHLGKNGSVATTNPALVHLWTGRQTVASNNLEENWQLWKQRGVRYVVCLQPADLPSSSLFDYKLLYRTSRRGLWVIEI